MGGGRGKENSSTGGGRGIKVPGAKQDKRQQWIITKIQRAPTRQQACKDEEDGRGVGWGAMQKPILCGKNCSFTLESYMQ